MKMGKKLITFRCIVLLGWLPGGTLKCSSLSIPWFGVFNSLSTPWHSYSMWDRSLQVHPVAQGSTCNNVVFKFIFLLKIIVQHKIKRYSPKKYISRFLSCSQLQWVVRKFIAAKRKLLLHHFAIFWGITFFQYLLQKQ